MRQKFAIYSDIHWSTYSSILRRRGAKYSVRLHNLINSMNWIENLAKQLGCTGEICCGDTFDKPQLDAEEITALQDVEWNDLPKTFIVGNHESNVSSLDYSSTKALEYFNVDVVSEVKKIQINDYVDFYFIPYITSDKVLKLSDVIDIDKNKKAVVFAHSDIAGLQYGKFTSQTGFDLNDILANCALFIDGHLHNEQTIDNRVVLVGNLTGQNFNENAKLYDHLAYVLTVEDDGKLILEPYENPYAFNFYKLKIETSDDLKLLDNLKQNSVVSIICSDFLSKFVEAKVNSLPNIIESRMSIVMTNTMSDSDVNVLKVDDHLKQFIDFVQLKLEQSPALDDELVRLGGGSL